MDAVPTELPANCLHRKLPSNERFSRCKITYSIPPELAGLRQRNK